MIDIIAPSVASTSLSIRSGMDHTFYLQTTPYLPFHLRKRSPDGATTCCIGKPLIAAYYSFIDPERMRGWVAIGLADWPHIAGDLHT